MKQLDINTQWSEIWERVTHEVPNDEAKSWYDSLDDNDKKLVEAYCKAFTIPLIAHLGLELKPIEIGCGAPQPIIPGFLPQGID